MFPFKSLLFENEFISLTTNSHNGFIRKYYPNSSIIYPYIINSMTKKYNYAIFIFHSNIPINLIHSSVSHTLQTYIYLASQFQLKLFPCKILFPYFVIFYDNQTITFISYLFTGSIPMADLRNIVE